MVDWHRLLHATSEQSFTDAFTYSLPIVAGLFVAAALLSFVLPKTAIEEETY